MSQAVVETQAAEHRAASWFSPNLRRGAVLPLAVVVLWLLATHLGWVNKHLVVKPELVLTRLATELREGELVPQILASLRRDLLGFAFGSAAGIAFGTAMGVFRPFEQLFGGTFHAAKQVALFAWVPLISVWFGNNEPAKVVFIALSAFYPVALNTQQGIESASRQHIEVAKTFEFSTWQITRKVLLPSALPSIFAGLHLGLIYSWLGTLGAEYLLAPAPGVGNLMIEGRETFAMDKVILGIVLAGSIGALLNALASWVEAKALRWRVTSV